MAVAIAINIAVGSIVFALRLPIYLDSIGTVLVGALAGPWAGALTGILSNLIWSILPIPGGAEPDGRVLRAGRRRHRPDGRLLGEPRRVPVPLGRRPRRRVPVARRRVRGAAFIVLRSSSRRSAWPSIRPIPNSQNRFVVIGVLIVLVGVAVAWITRTHRLRPQGRRPADPDVPRRRDGDRGVRPGRRLLPARCSARPATSRRSTARIPTATGRSARCSVAPT